MISTFQSCAKINLHLEVIGRRSDGFHELLTVFQSVALADRLTIEIAGSGVDLIVTRGDAPAGVANLAHRAAVDFLERWQPVSGVRIELEKWIPMGGGLGGGSSNAATVLRGLKQLTGVPEGFADLVPLARRLGADVPYFLYGGTALGRGRGDRIQPMADLEERDVWLVTPDLQISTAEIFAALGLDTATDLEPRTDDEWLRRLDWSAVGAGWNDLEATVFSRYPVVRDVYNGLGEAGADVVRLSGTGATLFAFFGEGTAPTELAARLPPGCRVVRTRTSTRVSLDTGLVDW